MNRIELEYEADYREKQRRRCFMAGKIEAGVIVWLFAVLRRRDR